MRYFFGILSVSALLLGTFAVPPHNMECLAGAIVFAILQLNETLRNK